MSKRLPAYTDAQWTIHHDVEGKVAKCEGMFRAEDSASTTHRFLNHRGLINRLERITDRESDEYCDGFRFRITLHPMHEATFSRILADKEYELLEARRERGGPDASRSGGFGFSPRHVYPQEYHNRMLREADQGQYESEIAVLAKTPRMNEGDVDALIRAQGWEARGSEMGLGKSDNMLGAWVTNPQDALQIALHLHDKGYMDDQRLRHVLEDVKDREKNNVPDPINVVVDASQEVRGKSFEKAYPPDLWVAKVGGKSSATKPLPPHSANSLEPRKKPKGRDSGPPTLFDL